jgi:hypothetical protein
MYRLCAPVLVMLESENQREVFEGWNLGLKESIVESLSSFKLDAELKATLVETISTVQTRQYAMTYLSIWVHSPYIDSKALLENK